MLFPKISETTRSVEVDGTPGGTVCQNVTEYCHVGMLPSTALTALGGVFGGWREGGAGCGCDRW